MTIYLYDDLGLQQNFKFPEKFLEVMYASAVPYPRPWSYILEFPDYARFWFRQAQTQYVDRCIVPFAIRDDNDDVACFDGNDHSGDPKVHIVHFFASAGWEDRGSYDNFEAWQKMAKQESIEYQRSQADNES